jgi:hypothetical protein
VNTNEEEAMTHITNKGRDLAFSLMQYGDYGTTAGIAETCSLIARHATTYQNLMEEGCTPPQFSWLSGMELIAAMEAWDADFTARDEALTNRLADLVLDLPHTDAGPWTLRLDGDPRGPVVRLVHPDGREVVVA